jgi:preprotein translocase subunit SecE
MANLIEFMREVKLESFKVTWPSRKETVMTTVVVFVMVTIVALILLAADSLIAGGIEFLLNTAAQNK